LSKRQLFDWSDSDLNFDDAAIRTFITNYHIFEPALEELITTDPDAYFELINGLYSILEDPSSALNWEDNANLGEFEQQLLAYFVQYDTFWIWAQDPTVPLADRLEVWDLLMEGAAYPSLSPSQAQAQQARLGRCYDPRVCRKIPHRQRRARRGRPQRS
jgi:hypothetical protein